MNPTLARLPLPPSSGGLAQTGSPRTNPHGTDERRKTALVPCHLFNVKPKLIATARLAITMLASNTVLGNWQRQLGAATAVIVTAVDPSLLVESRASPPGWTRLCHTQAAGAGPRMIQALKSGTSA